MADPAVVNVRVVCKLSPEPARTTPPSGFPVINNRLPDWTDTQLIAVREDGSEVSIGHLAQSITWRMEAGKPSVAIVEFIGAEIDVEAEMALPAKEPLPFPDCAGCAGVVGAPHHDACLAAAAKSQGWTPDPSEARDG